MTNKAWDYLKANYKADGKGRHKTTDAMKVACHFADEVARLRAKLQEIYDLHHNNTYDIFLRDDATYEIACEALGMKDD